MSEEGKQLPLEPSQTSRINEEAFELASSLYENLHSSDPKIVKKAKTELLKLQKKFKKGSNATGDILAKLKELNEQGKTNP